MQYQLEGKFIEESQDYGIIHSLYITFEIKRNVIKKIMKTVHKEGSRRTVKRETVYGYTVKLTPSVDNGSKWLTTPEEVIDYLKWNNLKITNNSEFFEWIRTGKTAGSGWHEPKDASGKAPLHKIAATKDTYNMILKEPMIRMHVQPVPEDCKTCGSCCVAHPCGIAPNEVYPIARYLRISIKELFDTYLTGDYWVTDSSDDIYVAPRRVGDRAETFDKVESDWGFPYPPRQCIFLTNKNLCRIHAVKPLTAKTSHCKLPGQKYKQRLSQEWAPYFKSRRNSNRDDEWLDYDQWVDYEKLERDFGGIK
jgi:Fe-S-cluster containining protein